MGKQVRSVPGSGVQGRSDEAEKRYNRRWLIAVGVGPLVVALVAVLWMFTVADRLPEQLATHWNSRNQVDGYSSLWGVVAMTIAAAAGTGSVISLLAVVTRSQNELLARIGAGFGQAMALVVTSLMVGIVAGHLEVVDAAQAEIFGPAVAGGLGAAFMVGALVVWQYKPGEIHRTPNAEVAAVAQAANTEGTHMVVAGRNQAAAGETMHVQVSLGPWAWAMSLGVGAVVAASLYFIFPALSVMGLVAGGIIWTFCRGTAVIGPDGLKVLASGYWPVMPLEWKDVRSATVEDIRALDFGGWGYRTNGGSVGFIMGSGPALVLEHGFHQRSVISMPDLETAGAAAALVSAYQDRVKVKK